MCSNIEACWQPYDLGLVKTKSRENEVGKERISSDFVKD